MIEIKRFPKKNALKINGGKTGNSREKKSKTVRILKKKNDERFFFSEFPENNEYCYINEMSGNCQISFEARQ